MSLKYQWKLTTRHWIHKTLNPQINDNFLTNYTWVDFNLYQNMVMLWWLEGIGPSCVTEKKFLLTTKGSGLFVLVWGKNVSCQWSTKHDFAVVQQNGREGKEVISLYICLCSSCHDNLFTMSYVHFMAFYFQTFIPIDNDIWFFLLFLWLEFSNK